MHSPQRPVRPSNIAQCKAAIAHCQTSDEALLVIGFYANPSLARARQVAALLNSKGDRTNAIELMSDCYVE